MATSLGMGLGASLGAGIGATLAAGLAIELGLGLGAVLGAVLRPGLATGVVDPQPAEIKTTAESAVASTYDLVFPNTLIAVGRRGCPFWFPMRLAKAKWLHGS